jgi:hypothetical protein
MDEVSRRGAGDGHESGARLHERGQTLRSVLRGELPSSIARRRKHGKKIGRAQGSLRPTCKLAAHFSSKKERLLRPHRSSAIAP